MSAPDHALALRGVTVLDLTQQLPGPYGTLLLAALGARVIKVEPPAGDAAREIDPVMFENVNVGKLSVVLDLKADAGREALHRLVAASDVFVEGFRPGVAARLGAGYEQLKGLKPDIVYCSLSGYGSEGPYRALPGHDLNYLGIAGGIDSRAAGAADTGQVGIPMVDLASGTMASFAIVAALLRRSSSGEGAFLDVAMLDSAFYWTGVKPPPASPDASEPAYCVVQCNDGLALTVAVLEDKFWRALCHALGWDDWAEDPTLETHALRQGRGAEVAARLRSTFATRPRAEWLEMLWEADLPVAPVHDRAAAAADPQVALRGLFTVDQTSGGTRLMPPLPLVLRAIAASSAPKLGAHTKAVLAEVGARA